MSAPPSEISLAAAIPELDELTAVRLRDLGVRTAGDLVRLPSGPLARRFGSRLARVQASLRGERLLPRAATVRESPRYVASVRWDDGCVRSDDLAAAVKRIAACLGARLARDGAAAATARVELVEDGGRAQVVRVRLPRPTCDARAFADALLPPVRAVRVQAPIVSACVEVTATAAAGTAQRLFPGDDEIARLRMPERIAAYGVAAFRARLCAAHRWEERFRYEPWTAPDEPPPPAANDRGGMRAQLCLVRPQEIPVRARGAQPLSVGRPPIAVTAWAGPFRVAESWSARPPRDEYDLVLEDGRIWRVHREGTRWLLCGIYD